MTTSGRPKRTLERFAALSAALVVSTVASLAVAAATLADHDGAAHPPGDPSRPYELVSPPYKIAGVGVGVAADGPGRATSAGAGAYVGERFAVGGTIGALLLDAPFATGNDWAFAQRIDGQVGWRSHSPITHPFRETENYRTIQLQAAAPDFSTVIWGPNAGHMPFFEESSALGPADDGSSLVSDWGSPPELPTRWEPIAPLAASQRIGSTGSYVFQAPAVSSDGTHLALTGPVRGLAGSGGFGCTRAGGVWVEVATGGPCPDPTVDTIGSNPNSAYIDDISAGLSDSWPGAGVRTPVATCTGQDGAPGLPRTRIPVRNPDLDADETNNSLGESVCAPAAANRGARLVSAHGSIFTTQSANANNIGTSTTNVITADGSRAFFMAPDPTDLSYAGFDRCVDTAASTKCPTQLYVRQRNADGEVVTRWLSRPEPGLLDDPQPAALLGAAYFEGASADGSKVFFHTDSPLTSDDPNGEFQTPANPSPDTQRGVGSWDLYMFELAPGPDGDPATPDGDPTGPGSKLTRITAGPTGTADCSTRPNVVEAAALRFASQDGERVYFSCSAPLGGVPDRATGTSAGTQGGTPTTDDQTNVYLYDANETDPADRYSFVARIPRTTSTSSVTNENLTRCASTAGLRGSSLLQSSTLLFLDRAVNCWRGTDDGAFALFWTLGRLTADDPDEFAADPSADLYAYDADSDELVRISAPQGSIDQTYPCGAVNAAADTDCYADPGLQESGLVQNIANPLLNVVTDPGAEGGRTVFFESVSRLVDGDQNSVYDVYRWHDGDLSLVSSGASGSDGTVYKGNSADGRNVYLATRDRLTWQDVDAVLDIYTARVGGGIPEPPPTPFCAVLADACHGGGAAGSQALVRTGAPRTGDAPPAARRRIAILRLSPRARRLAARRGALGLRVRVNTPGRVSVRAKARLGRRSVAAGRVSRTARKAGTLRLRLRLPASARRRLGSGRAVVVTVRATQPGALARSMSVVLRRADR